MRRHSNSGNRPSPVRTAVAEPGEIRGTIGATGTPQGAPRPAVPPAGVGMVSLVTGRPLVLVPSVTARVPRSNSR